MAKLFANNEDPDQTQHSDLGLHCWLSNDLGIYKLKRTKKSWGNSGVQFLNLLNSLSSYDFCCHSSVYLDKTAALACFLH